MKIYTDDTDAVQLRKVKITYKNGINNPSGIHIFTTENNTYTSGNGVDNTVGYLDMGAIGPNNRIYKNISYQSSYVNRDTTHSFDADAVDEDGEGELLDAIVEWMDTSQDKDDYEDSDVYGYGHISTWDVSKVTTFRNLFYNLDDPDEFNEDISLWNVSSVTDMEAAFEDCEEFNIDISNWDVSNVTDMSWMFGGAEAFNQPINRWNVSSVENMSHMFRKAKWFNQEIGGWDVSSVTNMEYMFYVAESFNQYIGGWDVSR